MHDDDVLPSREAHYVAAAAVIQTHTNLYDFTAQKQQMP